MERTVKREAFIYHAHECNLSFVEELLEKMMFYAYCA